MSSLWAQTVEASGKTGPDYWNYFAQRLVDLAAIPPEAVILDVGTDNGNVLFKAMEKAGLEGFGAGIDIDHRGLIEGMPYLERHWPKNVIFAQMEASSLGFPSDSFSFALANFVGWDYCYEFESMKFIAPDTRLAEIRRVLKPGGQVGIGGWIEQSDIDWFIEEIRKRLPECLGSTGEDIFPYSKENAEGYQILLRSSGFRNIRVHVVKENFVLPDGDSWWRQMQHSAYEYFELISHSAKLEAFKKQVFSELEQFRTEAGIQFSKTVAFVFGTK